MAERWNLWAPVPLRLMWGVAFMIHGWPKVFDAGTREGIAQMIGGQLGWFWPGFWAWIVALTELLGGLALVVGFLVPLVAIPLIVDMLVALFWVHLPQGFSFIHIVGMQDGRPQFGMPGYEVNLLYLAGLLTLLIGGAGAVSIDAARRGRAGPRPPA